MASQDRKSVNQITFNRKNIRSLATDKRRRVWDSELKGFFILVLPSGVKTYWISYRIAGDTTNKKHELRIGDVLTYENPETARNIAREKLALASKGLNPKVMITESHGSDYFPDLVNDWKNSNYFTDLADTTKRNFNHRLTAYLQPKFKPYRIVDITVQVIRKYYEENIKKHGNNVANMNHRLLSSLLTFAKDKDYIDINPCINAIPKKLRQPDTKRYFELDNKILAKVHKGITSYGESELGNPYSYFLFRCVQYLGFRPSEICTLRWSKDQNLKKLQNYVDLDRKVFIYEKIKNWNMVKQGVPKLVNIPDYIFNLLKKLPKLENNPYVLPSLNVVGDHYKKYDKAWSRVQQFGKFKLSLRDLRPVFISLASYEFGIEKTSKYIGHSSTKMTEYYVKPIPKQDRAFANEMFESTLEKYTAAK